MPFQPEAGTSMRTVDLPDSFLDPNLRLGGVLSSDPGSSMYLFNTFSHAKLRSTFACRAFADPSTFLVLIYLLQPSCLSVERVSLPRMRMQYCLALSSNEIEQPIENPDLTSG